MTTRDITSFNNSPYTTIDQIRYDFSGRVLGVYVTVEDDSYKGRYWVTSFMIEPLSCKFKKLDLPDGITMNAMYYLPYVHIDACLDALEQAQEQGRGGVLTSG